MNAQHRDVLVQTTRLSSLGAWNRNMGIETILVDLRKEMASQANRRLAQPPEGTTF
jgi:ubiquitin-conjugating enzyme E2 variant